MSIKGKLLEAVGEVNIEDIGTEALVDILVSRIKAQDKRIQELNGENGRERQRLHDETERLYRERKQMRSDPLYGAYGEYYFLGRDGGRFCLSMQNGTIARLYERFKKNDWPMQQVSGQQWEIMEEAEQKKKYPQPSRDNGGSMDDKMREDKYIIGEMLMAYADGKTGQHHENYAFSDKEENGMRNVLALLITKGWQASRAAQPETIMQAQAAADVILANFKTEGNRTKAEEWGACYAMLFKQFIELTEKVKCAPQPVDDGLIRELDRNFCKAYSRACISPTSDDLDRMQNNFAELLRHIRAHQKPASEPGKVSVDDGLMKLVEDMELIEREYVRLNDVLRLLRAHRQAAGKPKVSAQKCAEAAVRFNSDHTHYAHIMDKWRAISKAVLDSAIKQGAEIIYE